MIKNYFKTAFRSLWRNKSTSFINLFGLSVGMTVSVFILLWVRNELSFDSYHPDADRIFRITHSIATNKDESWVWELSPMALGPAAASEVPEVQQMARASIRTDFGPSFKIDNQLFEEKPSAFVDKSWFQIFHYDFIAGNAEAFSKDPFGIVLTQTEATKYFGSAVAAMGHTVGVDTVSYTVTGVVKDNPLNSSFQFSAIMQLEGRLAHARTRTQNPTWNNFDYVTFLKLRPGASKSVVEAKLNDIINRNRQTHTDKVSLEPLRSMYFENDLQNSNLPHGNKATVRIFCLLALVLLVIACINYVNLTTAKASLRAREVSVRKIVGAGKASLFLQFVVESLMVTMMALLVTIALLQLTLPLFNRITEMHFTLPFNSFAVWEVLLATLALAVVLNSVYPAMLLSSFSPLNVFRGMSVLKLKDGTVRKGLVVFQFTLSMILITGTVVMYRQMQLVQQSNAGYNMSQVLIFRSPWKKLITLDQAQSRSFMSTLRHDLERMPGVAEVTNGAEPLINVGSYSSGSADWEGRDTTFNPTIARLSGDAGFQRFFHLQMVAGRWFNSNNEQHSFILNETAAKTFHMHQPVIGQRLIWGGDTGQVVGIVKDFHFKSLHEKIGPMVISNSEGTDPYFYIRISPGNIRRTTSAITSLWAKYSPDEPFNYNFLDDAFNALYKRDIKTSKLMLIFAAIAIIISALGLLGLAAFTAEQRTKEIGIRKVLGASVQQITVLLSKDFVKLVVVAVLIAGPVAWWLTNKWLQDFAYRITLTPWIFLGAGLLAMLIALISVSGQAVRSASANPVKSLRTE